MDFTSSFFIDSTGKAITASVFLMLLKQIFTFQYMNLSDSIIFKGTVMNLKEFHHFTEDFCYILSCNKTNNDVVDLASLTLTSL